MQSKFYEIVDYLTGKLAGEEILLANYSGENSDFVRLNHAAVRQAGSVNQAYLGLKLIVGKRSSMATCTLTGDAAVDRGRTEKMLAELRDRLPSMPEDPYLLYNTKPKNSEQFGLCKLPDSGEAIKTIINEAAGLDLVGIFAAGEITQGFANSLGQRNWFSTHSFNFDWSIYHSTDKAVKCSYAGFEWENRQLARRMADARSQLEVLGRPAKVVKPGGYRVYLAPAALEEIMSILCWGGFGLKEHRTKNTCLLKMLDEGRTLHPSLTLRENTAEGLAPNFQAEGFLRPASVTLIEDGKLIGAMVSPRSAAEYRVETNGSHDGEYPDSLDMAAGDMPREDAAGRIGEGVYINSLWYLNYSDRPNCRITGMTRFATFWVEEGEIVAPLNVMRFDDTVYRMLGENLLALTKDRDMLPSASTYGARSTTSMRLPGALIDDFTFTL